MKLPESSVDYVRMSLNPVVFFSQFFLLCVYIPSLTLSGPGILGRLLNLFMYQFHLYSEDDYSTLLIVLAGLNEIIHGKHLEQCLAHRKH